MMAGDHVCVEVTDYELRWLWYSSKGRNKSIFASVRFEITPLPQGIIKQGRVLQPEEFRSILQGYLEKRRSEFRLHRKPKISIGLPLQNQFIRQYSLPWVRRRDRAGLVRYLAEEEIPIPKDELVYDYFLEEGNGSPPRLKVVLAGIRESFYLPIVECFGEAGFAIHKVSFSQLAWGNVLGFNAEDHVLFLREDEGQIQYIYYKGRIPEIVRSFPTAVWHYGTEEWHNEIHRMHLYLSSLHSHVELSKILYGPGRETQEVGEKIAEYLQHNRGKAPLLQGVEETFTALGGSAQIDSLEFSERLLTVLGLALEEEQGSLCNFCRGEILKQKQQRAKWVAAGLILLMNLSGLGLLVSSQQILHNLKVEVQHINELKNAAVMAQEQARERRQAWERITSNSTRVGHAIHELTTYDAERIRLERIEIKGQTLLIQGFATESMEVQRVFQQLKATGWRKVQLAKYQLAEDSFGEGMPIQFTLQAEKYE